MVVRDRWAVGRKWSLAQVALYMVYDIYCIDHMIVDISDFNVIQLKLKWLIARVRNYTQCFLFKLFRSLH